MLCLLTIDLASLVSLYLRGREKGRDGQRDRGREDGREKRNKKKAIQGTNLKEYAREQ